MTTELGLDKNDLESGDNRMFQFTYPAKIKKDEAGLFLVTFPDIPFAGTARNWHQQVRTGAQAGCG